MSKFFTNTHSVTNLYKKMSTKSEIVTQMLYGDSFNVIRKKNKWLKIKIKEDGYQGYIKNRQLTCFIKPTHKIHVLKAKIYKFPNKKKKINELSFASKIRAKKKKFQFFQFEKGWIHQKDIKPLNFKDKNTFKRIELFKKIKYKWGGKSYKGIDCSGLIQVFFNFNNKFCPRDAKDQFIFLKKNISLKKIKKNDIIYWKGHVAVALSKNKLIHAYGPMKKTVVTKINETIERINKTAKLKVIGVKRV